MSAENPPKVVRAGLGVFGFLYLLKCPEVFYYLKHAQRRYARRNP